MYFIDLTFHWIQTQPKKVAQELEEWREYVG